MIKSSKILGLLDVVLDWWGLAISALLLAGGISDYRDGGSLAWPIAGAVLVLVSLWVVYRRVVPRDRRPTGPRT